MIPLAAFEEIIEASGIPPRIEAMLPVGVRARQLSVRALLAGICLAQADHRPARLTRVHQALTGLSEDDQRRLGVVADWKHGPHRLTCRQTEYTFGPVADAFGKDEPGGLPSPALQAACHDLLQASVPQDFKDASRSPAVDWTDLESFSGPRRTAPATAPTPKRPGGTARTTCCAAKTSWTGGITCPPAPWCPKRAGRPFPNSPAARRCHRAGTTRSGPSPRADRDARAGDPARRHPR